MAAEQVERWAASQLGDTFDARAQFERWLHSEPEAPTEADEFLEALGMSRAS